MHRAGVRTATVTQYGKYDPHDATMNMERQRKPSGTYSAVEMKEWIDTEWEFIQWVGEGMMSRLALYEEWANGVSTTGVMVYAPLSLKPPYTSWEDFTTKLQEFFMTTETQDKAIWQIQALSQGTSPIEDYIIWFKSIASLTRFNNYALIACFKAGLNPLLGFEVIKNGAPANDNLDAWYDRSTELARGYQDAKKTFGDQGQKNDCSSQSRGNHNESMLVASTSKTTKTPQASNTMDIDWKRTPFRCYNCGKPGHMVLRSPSVALVLH
jgi:hypothetical protein